MLSEIVGALFVNVNGDRGERLVITGALHQDYGGWSESALLDHLCAALTPAVAGGEREEITPRRLQDAAMLLKRIEVARDLEESDAMVIQAVAHWVLVHEEQRAAPVREPRGGDDGE